ncbi:acyl dehydratase [Streptosporangium becharense]|uniref:Acyl dehydratase n=1 Tax=Streptosporangium becharense TaxID=1816182 RepID=A0A7W9IJF4_9ACTN|nr:MaoC family dehydratase N-terminal domain-containing protein [Streptosporangium becharense]MBB2911241.1 acyl dehydratase [Streptosporangium becharense]MBB5821701.1 acyl dehydratase [Streptosporangium becharense]
MRLQDALGVVFPPHDVVVERGRLRLFAKVTGQEDPVYVDVDAAARAGHRDLPVPPTFLFCLEMEQPGDPLAYIRDLGVDLRKVLHGEQRFDYRGMAYAGDTLTFASRITDAYRKKGGKLTFLIRTTRVTRAGTPVADLSSTIVVTS